MSEDEVTLGMSVPLDSDGFLRRECPTCEREFKWLPSDEDEVDSPSVPDGGYFCPYCGVQAPAGSWFTQAQSELAENIVATEVVAPMLKDFKRAIEGIGRRSGGFIRASGRLDEPNKSDPLTEVDDMKRVDLECHPLEPLKIRDDWDRPVHCLICGGFGP